MSCFFYAPCYVAIARLRYVISQREQRLLNESDIGDEDPVRGQQSPQTAMESRQWCSVRSRACLE